MAAVVATAFVFLGHFAWDAQSAMTSFVLLLTAIGTPWAVITLIGYVRCRGRTTRTPCRSSTAARGAASTGTARAGTSRATASWALGAAVGLLAVSTPVVRGPAARPDGRGGLQLPPVGPGRRA